MKSIFLCLAIAQQIAGSKNVCSYADTLKLTGAKAVSVHAVRMYLGNLNSLGATLTSQGNLAQLRAHLEYIWEAYKRSGRYWCPLEKPYATWPLSGTFGEAREYQRKPI